MIKHGVVKLKARLFLPTSCKMNNLLGGIVVLHGLVLGFVRAWGLLPQAEATQVALEKTQFFNPTSAQG